MGKSELAVYSDSKFGPISGMIGTPITTAIQCFIYNATYNDDGTCTLKTDGPLDTATGNKSVVAAKENGKRKVLVSFGGSTMRHEYWMPLARHVDVLAKTLADFVKKNDFDGIDIDWEDSEAVLSGKYDPVTFLVDLSVALRKELPAEDYLITHAPEAPYFAPEWANGFYLDVAKQAGDAIDFFYIQYYNNPSYVGDSDKQYTQLIAGTEVVDTSLYPYTVQGMVNGEVFPSSIVGLVNAGLPVEKLLVGQPTSSRNAGSGVIPAQTLSETVIKPLREKYGSSFGGVMGWQFAIAGNDNIGVATDWVNAVSGALTANS